MKTIKSIGTLALCVILIAAYGFVQQPGGKEKPKPDKAEKMGTQENKTGTQDKTEKMDGQNPNTQRSTEQDKGRKMNGGQSNPQSKAEKMGGQGQRDSKTSGEQDKGNKMGRQDNGKNADKSHSSNGDKAHKITICHKTGGNPVTISVSERAWPAHAAHGDVRGDCGPSKGKKLDKKLDDRRRLVYVRLADADDLMIRSSDVIDVARYRIGLARISLDAARKSGRFTAVQLRDREDRIIVVERRTSSLENLLMATRNDMRVRDSQVEILVAR